ncbi:hypothetical protein PAXRUDRAFT_821769 [Paxillus rubicundulus Ve08.2h10]|uniref:Unplaced genomic scaffold scaffold_14, whole genome shotgun sequence n=1 Tax=Paxillus rubicundulus Ve08.2h10 TaxID=930991 RepID=A0A0D0DN59_9AGAM|nr:hypothetical protein PAXRUDRAFT_821769 [Paxillus rubicundulus Ve08.2h10]
MERHATSRTSSGVPPSTRPILLSGRSHLYRVEEGLWGTTGAQKVISQLNTQRSAVTKLTLNCNPLGDDGVAQLFNYLSSMAGSRHRATLSEISLTSNNIGCRGLQAISEYIRGNDVLNSLSMANNVLIPDAVSFSSFASAVNSSRLRFLSLSSNHQLGDAFVERFLPLLHSRHLHELHINAVGLTARSAPVIGAWISSKSLRNSGGACCLETLKCSGNSLGVRGVWEIIQAVEKGNWGLVKVEMYANQLAESPDTGAISFAHQASETESSRVPETEEAWKDSERALHRVLMRNGYWKRQTEKEALILLRYSRPLLLRPKSSLITSSPSQPPSPPLPSATTSFPFYALPNELKLYILALLAPSLSSPQRMRLCNYASDPSTLPPLLPPLRRDLGKGCLADPSSVLGATIGFPVITPGVSGQRCAEGKCMGAGNSLHCRREEERNRFLEAVGCCAYEPEPAS